MLGNVHVKAPKVGTKSGNGVKRRKEEEDERPNDVIGLLRKYPSIQCVCFIGVKARATFLRHHQAATAASGGSTVYVANDEGRGGRGRGGGGGREVTLCVLPSSNAANTRVTHGTKVNEWRSALLG